MTGTRRSRLRTSRLSNLSAHQMGLAVLAALVLIGFLSFQKVRIGTVMGGGEELKAEFARHYKLKPYSSGVKLAGVTVGVVTGVDKTDRGTVMVSMKVDDGVREKLGREPSAAIRPTLVVGGRYYVSLTPGGLGGAPVNATIPMEHTEVPVELDRVLSTITPDAGKGVRTAIRQTDAALRSGGQRELEQLLANAPGTLRPMGDVAQAMLGQRPATDLNEMVRGLRSAATTLNRDAGQLDAIFDSFRDSTAAFAAASEPLAEAVHDGPETLRVTRAGLQDLRGTLDKVAVTAQEFQPSARALAPILRDLDPVLARAVPMLQDLRTVVTDTRPTLRYLAPAVGDATSVFQDVRGPVLEKVNGPFADLVLSPWSGTGPYENGGNSHKLYEELAYLTAAGARVFQTHDANGSQGRLMAGFGGRTLGGAAFPKSLEQYLEDIFGMHLPPGPQEGKEPGGDGQVPIIPVPGGETP